MEDEISHFSKEVTRLMAVESKYETQINELKKVMLSNKQSHLNPFDYALFMSKVSKFEIFRNSKSK